MCKSQRTASSFCLWLLASFRLEGGLDAAKERERVRLGRGIGHVRLVSSGPRSRRSGFELTQVSKSRSFDNSGLALGNLPRAV